MRLKFVQSFVDKRSGAVFSYFRRRGYPHVRLPGLPGSREFMEGRRQDNHGRAADKRTQNPGSSETYTYCDAGQPLVSVAAPSQVRVIPDLAGSAARSGSMCRASDTMAGAKARSIARAAQGVTLVASTVR